MEYWYAARDRMGGQFKYLRHCWRKNFEHENKKSVIYNLHSSFELPTAPSSSGNSIPERRQDRSDRDSSDVVITNYNNLSGLESEYQAAVTMADVTQADFLG